MNVKKCIIWGEEVWIFCWKLYFRVWMDIMMKMGKAWGDSTNVENDEKACFEALYFYRVAVFGERAIAVFQKHKTMSRENQDKAYFI